MNNKNLLLRSVFAALLVLAVSFMSPAKGAALEIAHAKNFNIEYLSGDIKVVTAAFPSTGPSPATDSALSPGYCTRGISTAVSPPI